MSPRSATSEGGGGGRIAVSALLVVAVAVAMMLLIRATPQSEPFDPQSGEWNGTRGLVLLLDRYGVEARATRDLPSLGGDERILVLEDRLSDAQRDSLLAYAADGGVVVVADPTSPLTAGRFGAVEFDYSGVEITGATGDARRDIITLPPDSCDAAVMAHLRGLFVQVGVRFTVPAGATGCFGRGSTAFAVVEPIGDGFLVGLGDNLMFTNSGLSFADNAALATALLAPERGLTVVILRGEGAAPTAADIGTGDKTLFDLVRPGVWMALAMLALAFVLVALARAIRPGRPVREPEQVPVAGSELVSATGNLMQRARHAQRAGWLLRGQLYRELCKRLHLPPTVAIAEVDTAAATRFGLELGHVAAVLEREVFDDAALVRLSNDLEAIRNRVVAPASPSHLDPSLSDSLGPDMQGVSS
ncbi:MAG TPA: hypothetical protein DCR14_19450 [Acidimicrobiaceae bacterium]|nr:hypothetical protein [Acidimicrobiaceae bacterium]